MNTINTFYTNNNNSYNPINKKNTNHSYNSYEFNPYNIPTKWMDHNKDTLFSSMTNIDGGHDILSYKMEYAKDSTKDNPKILVSGKYSVRNENYEEIITLKDIDLSNATKFELQALRSHLAVNNKNFKDLNIDAPASNGIVFEYGKRYDFISLFQRDVDIYRQGGYYDLSLRKKKALDIFMDFFDRR